MTDTYDAGPSFATMLASHRQSLQAYASGAPCSPADLLTHPILTYAEPLSAATLKQRLDASDSSQRETEATAAKEKLNLTQALEALLASTRAKGNQLTHLPDEIGSMEDALGELCVELEGKQAEADASAASTAVPTSTLLQTLSSQHSLLRELEAVRDYLSVLAKAEELKLLAIKAEDKDDGESSSKDEKASPDPLVCLAELSSLAKRVKSVAGDKNVKAIASIESQKAQAFAHLVKRREERLSKALEEAGWPPPPPELQTARGSARDEDEVVSLTSANVRRRWRKVMMLQRKSEKLSILQPASARIPSDLDEEEEGGLMRKSSSAPGSNEYQPLLAVQCLLRPLLLRFYFHFDSDRPTNRLDKPEWYMSHIISVLRSNAATFDPRHGAVADLCNNVSRSRGELRYDLSAELLHGLLRPLTLKLESSIPLLLQNAQLLSHTIMQSVQFDQDLRSMLMPVVASTTYIYLADALLSNESVFEAWVQSERAFANDRLEQELDSSGAWLVGDETGLDESSADGSWAAMVQEGGMQPGQNLDQQGSSTTGIKTTRSARAVIDLVDGLTARYSALPSVHHQLPFLLIQLSMLQGYAQRLERSLDAFESLSSAFSRAIPGAIAGGGDGPGGGGAGGGGGLGSSEQDMVRGLRGLGRLLKACLSALFVAAHLEALSSQNSFVDMGAALSKSGEGSKLLGDFRKWQGEEEERELDQASLGELVRRGWRTGGRFASGMRPLGASNAAPSGAAASVDVVKQHSTNDNSTTGTIDVWEKTRTRYEELSQRALHGIEKMVASEVLEGMRAYAQRDWDDEDVEGTEDADEAFDIPTPSLLPCLSTLSLLLHHLVPSLPRLYANQTYRSIADAISTAVVDRVVFAGGAHRFSLRGGQRFKQDFQQGWLAVVHDVNGRLARQQLLPAPTALGAWPQAPWGYLVDAAKLLTLTDEEDGSTNEAENAKVQQPTLQQACRAAFEPTMAGPSWQEVVEMLSIDERMSLRVAREILRRRTECPW